MPDTINDLDRPFLKDLSYDPNKAVSLIKDIKAEEFSKNILSLDLKIRFAGLIERSGYCLQEVLEKEFNNT
jgi:hypothetical protein